MSAALATIGHNNPPADPFGAIKAHLDDLLLEAHNWADGVAVETAEQEAEAERLIKDLRDGAAEAEAKRVEEKAPLDKQIAEIQDRYNVYIAPKTNKKPGKVILAIAALLATVEPYRQRLAKEKADAAEAAAKEAAAKAQAAADAARAVAPSDLGGREAVEALIADAGFAQREAARAANNATKGLGLKTEYEPILINQREAILHYMKDQPNQFVTLVVDLAKAEVRDGKRSIPGFEIQARQKAI